MARTKTRKKSQVPYLVGRALVIPDCHIPYHDKNNFDLMVKVAKQSNITEVVILGDFGEYYFASSHANNPGVRKDAVWELTEIRRHLVILEKAFPKAKKVFIEGNHEYRLPRYLASSAAELDGIPEVSVPRLLRLREGGWHWVPYGPNQLYQIANSYLFARHEPYSNGTHVAHASVVKAGLSIIFGHCHRIMESQVVMADGANHRGVSPGWLGDKTHPIFNFVKNHHQWADGFSIVDIMSDGTFFNHTTHIIRGMCSFAGKIWRSN